MAAVDALLQLRIDVERHLRVGVADLAHDPFHVEVVRQQRDGDARAAQCVRRGVGQRGKALGDELRAGSLRGFLDDLADALATDAPAVEVRHEVVVRPGRQARATQPVDVVDHCLHEVRRHLHLADARLGLRVGDAEASAVLVVQADVADPHVAQLADARAAAPEDLTHDAPADVATTDVPVESAQVPCDRASRDAELLGDLRGSLALREHVRDEARGRAELRERWCIRQWRVLRGRGVQQRCQLVHLKERALRLRDAHAHALPASRVVLDVAVLDRVIEDRRERVDQLADRGRRERDRSPAARVADVGASVERGA
ncbi:MAG TPA: hypothetical protein VKB03_16395 [Conexibacter sp.]|nr:hypothetical protein [Conexibacter sp.]